MDIAIESVCTDSYDSIRKVLKTSGKLVCVGVLSTITFDSVSSDMLGNHLLPELALQRPLMDRATFYYLFDKVAINSNQFNRDFQNFFKILREGLIEPRIVEKIPLNKIVKALLN